MPRKKKPVKLFTLDTETIGLDGPIRRIAIYDGEKIHYGYKFEDVEPVLIEASKDYKVHCYIHNMNFDLRKTPTVFRPGNVRWNKCLVINRRYVTLECQDYIFHDSWQIINTSLEKASESFNLENGKLDLWDEVQKVYPGQYKDKVHFLSTCPVDDPLYIKYLGYDVLGLYELMMKLVEVSTIPLEKLVKCPTTASLSKYILKNGYNGKPFKGENRIKTDFEIMTSNKYWNSEKPLLQFPEVTYKELEYKIREAYYGGRTEVFKPYSGKAYYYDVNSLYPYACLNEFPIGVPEFYTDKIIMSYKWRWWIDNHRGLGFIKCKVFIPKQDIPPLPSRLDKLCFLTGYIEGSWTFHEIEYAVKNCGVKIIEMLEMIYFPKTYPVYKNFIETLSVLKEEASISGNGALRQFSKDLMNTAYGWTCMSRDNKTELDFIEKAEKYIEDNRLLTYDKELGFCEVKSIVRTQTIQVQIGAYVTSYARLILLDALRKQAKKGAVYYCDTDSIICEAPMDNEMVHKTKLGKFDLEHNIIEGLFIQPKVYSIITPEKLAIKFKGVPKEHANKFDFNFYQKIYKALCEKQTGEIPVAENIERLPNLYTAQKNNKNPNELIITHKSIKLENVQKRNMNYKNNSSEPWFMSSFEEFYNFDFSDIDFAGGDYFEKRRK